jgi:hypothetical protein
MNNMTDANTVPPRPATAARENVRIVDEEGLCFNCDLVQTFAIIIKEQTNIGGDAAIDPAGVLAEYARSRVLEIRDDDKAKDFSLMSALGWFEVGKITEGKRR